jgi:hypothetical protein
MSILDVLMAANAWLPWDSARYAFEGLIIYASVMERIKSLNVQRRLRVNESEYGGIYVESPRATYSNANVMVERMPNSAPKG